MGRAVSGANIKPKGKLHFLDVYGDNFYKINYSYIYKYNYFVGRVLRLRRATHWQKYASFDSLLSRAA